MYKKVSCTEDLLIYFCPFHFGRRLPLHHVIFWGVNYKYINESFAFSSGEICRMIISLHEGFRLRSCPHQPVFDSRTCISACWFLALSHQKRLSPDMSLLPGFSQTRLLHTALASTAPPVFSFFPLTTCPA